MISSHRVGFFFHRKSWQPILISQHISRELFLLLSTEQLLLVLSRESLVVSFAQHWAENHQRIICFAQHRAEKHFFFSTLSRESDNQFFFCSALSRESFHTKQRIISFALHQAENCSALSREKFLLLSILLSTEQRIAQHVSKGSFLLISTKQGIRFPATPTSTSFHISLI